MLLPVALEHHDLGAAPPLDTHNLGAEGQPYGLAFELRGQHGSGVGVLTGQEPDIQADDRHLTAEPPECLRQLAPDRASPDNQQPFGQLSQREHGLVGEKAGLGETRNGRRGRP